MTSVYDTGDQVPLRHKVYSGTGALTDATVTLTVTKPDGSTTSPTITHPSTGTYEADVTTDAAGIWLFRWSVSGTVPTDYVDGQFTVVTSAPPAYATLDDLKLALGITNDVTRDGLLLNALATASRYVDRKCGRRFYIDRSASARVYVPNGRLVATACGQRFLVDDIGSTTGLVVEVGSSGGSYTTISTYETGPENALARGWPIESFAFTTNAPIWWPWGASMRVRVTARWGWPAIPDDVSQATLLYASRLFRRKDSPEGVAGITEWGTVRVSSRDPDVEGLLSHYMVPGFA